MSLDGILQLGWIFVAAFFVAFSGALMPGPLLAVTISESSRRGALAGPLLMTGHALLEAALVAAVVFGLGGVLKRPAVIGGIGLAGGLLMGGMGLGMIRSHRRLALQPGRVQEQRLHPVAAGMLVSLSNPYWTIWWATIGMGYLAIGIRYGWLGILTFFAGHIAADFAWYSLVSFSIARSRKFVTDAWYRRLIAGCGAALVVFGCWFLYTGVKSLIRS
jgi:threonine/homoserine/homoserine lactone efflux protein